MKFQYDDGGREAAGFKGRANDCVTRSVSIITGKPYREVYDEINKLCKTEQRGVKRSTARSGVRSTTVKRYLESIGYKWTPTMQIGSGCRVHLRDGELPMGRLIVNVSKHITAVVDGVIHDTFNPQRSGNRCVYGYWQKNS